ncbi:MAG: GNAT family N-acetyltransferase, partial [Erythrobacter sp.]|nr:GNAT family N-acetyltransferase [Erythrobacter sp.]
MTYFRGLDASEWRSEWRGPSWRNVAVRLREGFSALPWPDCHGPAFVEQWDKLAHAAVSPNPFNEHWFALPGLNAFDSNGEVRLASLVRDGRLVGLLPISFSRRYHGRSLPHIAGWQHPNSFCGEPLILPGFEEEFWTELLGWADRQNGMSTFLHLGGMPADSPTLAALHAVGADTARAPAIVHREERAVLRHGLSPEEHLAAAASKKRRKDWARRRRRLEEEGELTVSRRDDHEGIAEWIDEFLDLERAGWKGEEGSALASDPRTEALFRDSLMGAAATGRLQRLAFHLDSKPVVMLANFLSPPHAFSFKTAYDEDLARFSPGVLLQLENLALLERDDIELCDSCAAPDHPMIDHIWRDRRAIVKISVPIGGRIRKWVGSILTTL